ncbi:MAG: hypothetical protein LBG58_08360 [Planctomycetaceae bacterium]|jgi:hypothetical protein|nr:hypothetical protein [Planctomycetaceae bacterium]
MLKTEHLHILGNVYRSEFSSIYRQIIETVPDSVSEYPVSILFQSYPGEFSQSVVDELIIAEPFSPVLLFLGSALEGESRTGHPLVGCFRFYVHQWSGEYRHQLFLYWSGKPSFFTLPRTVENDEIAIFHAVSASYAVNVRSNEDIPSSRNALIVSRLGTLGNDWAMNQFLAVFYRQQGFETEFLNWRVFSPLFDGLIIADTDDSPFPQILESVQRLRCGFADSKITVYINSPRINEKSDLRDSGVDEIISKPVFW